MKRISRKTLLFTVLALGGLGLLGLASFEPAWAFGSDFAICAHPSHGTAGWTGPVRTGPTSNADAWKDANAHNKAYPGHSAGV